jgi:hypothetical protein
MAVTEHSRFEATMADHHFRKMQTFKPENWRVQLERKEGVECIVATHPGTYVVSFILRPGGQYSLVGYRERWRGGNVKTKRLYQAYLPPEVITRCKSLATLYDLHKEER